MNSPYRSSRIRVHKRITSSLTFSRVSLTRKIVCLVLLANLLIWPTPGLAKDLESASIAALSSTITLTTGSLRAVSHFLSLLFGIRRAQTRGETTAERTAAVTNIQINPTRIVGYTDQQLHFSATGSNVNGQTIQGVQFSWSSSDQEKLQIDNSGMSTLISPGVVWVSASTSIVSSQVPVLIRQGPRPVQTDEEWNADQSQLHPDGTVGTVTGGVGSILDTLMETLAPTAHAQANGGDSGDFLYDELWSDPKNLVGSPRNRIATTSAIGGVLPEGSNFEFSVPLYALSGRGVSTGIALSYNSRIWSEHSSAVTFNAVNSWPYLGFTLSFGRIVTYGTSGSTKFVLIDSDGTRHYLGTGAIGTTNTYQTNDGSHIIYVGNGTTGGNIYYGNGMNKAVSMINNRLLVQTVTDQNGNQFTISYKSLSQTNNNCLDARGHQSIDKITDTLGRDLKFNYDSNNNLISIDTPGYGGTAGSPVTTTIVRFDYTSAAPSTSFSGLTVENVPGSCQANLLSHVFFPATSTGHKFTYSAYGMISTVSLRKDMTYNSGTGAITDGNEKAYVTFNYPASASSLTSAPSFTQWTQSPGATTGGTSTWSFTSSSGSGILSYIVTNPDSTTLALTRSTTGTYNGLLTQSEVKTSGGTSMAKSVIGYTTDGGGETQVDNVVSYDDASNQTKVDFSYDSYGNISNTREYGFQQSGSWVVRRRTRNVYKTDTSYVNAYLRSLIVENDVYDAQLDTNDGNDVLVAETTYTYDNYSAMGGMEDYSGTTYNVGRASGYGTSNTLRGNVTGVTQYTDVSAPTSITHLRKIDIFGNVVKEELSCCNQQATVTNDTNGFAMPTSVVKGDPLGTTLTTQYDSDFNTSLKKHTIDPNSLQTTVSSRDSALRPTQVDLPIGSSPLPNVTATYNDSTMSVSNSKVYDDGGTTKTITETTEYDGWGRVIHEKNIHGGEVDTRYDNMGRVASKSNPYAIGGSPSYWTSYTYDALGRVTTVTLPDSQTTTTSYTGNAVTLTDQVGRQTQQVTDGLGRLVTVNEQDLSTGYLTVSTSYAYDYLNNLTQVDQGGQLRKYKYDALSRLLYEKIPEQTASINDGSGTYWTSKYTYTDFNSVSTKTDARGVVTTNTYDSLHRLTQISYNTVSGITTAPSVAYYYDYDATYSITNNGQLVRALTGTTTAGYDEYYTVDADKRPTSTIRKVYTSGGTTRTYTTSYSLNDANQITQLTYQSGLSVATTHDSAGRITGLQNTSTLTNYLSNIGYSVAGQITGDALGNGVTEQFGYDAARMQLTSQKAGTTSPYTNRMNLNYSYAATSGQMGYGSTAGNAGQLMKVDSSNSTINGTTEGATYTYDNYGRLVTSDQTSNGSSTQRRFAYDRWGNRTVVWDATSGGNQIQNIALDTSGGIPTNKIQTVNGPRTNVALSSNGATASASTTSSTSYPASAAINGDRRGTGWGSGGGWMDKTSNSYPDWLEVDFSGSKTIDEIDVFTLQDNYTSPSDPTTSMTFSLYGIVDFQLQYWDGGSGSWVTVSGGNISGNNKVWKQVTFSQITTNKIRVNVTSALSNFSRVTELEAWGTDPALTYSYDAAGNVTNDGVHSYGYDSVSRLISVDGGSTATYLYDHKNRRYSTSVGGTVTHCVWEGLQVVAEYNGSTGALLTDYLYSNGRMLASVASGTTRYFCKDRLSNRLILDSSGNAAGRTGHLPFGEDFAESGSQEKHHFTGYERDAEKSVDYAINRQYDQSVGRFTAADPYRQSAMSESPQSWNRYTYVGADPINKVDRTGLFSSTWSDSCNPVFGCIADYAGDFTSYADASPDVPKTCITTQNIAKGASVQGHYPPAVRIPFLNPNKHPIGDDIDIFTDRWFYLFEINASLTGLNPQAAVVTTTKLVTGVYTFERDGLLLDDTYEDKGYDTPDERNIDSSSRSGYISWIDMPNIRRRTPEGHQIVDADITWILHFTVSGYSGPLCEGVTYLHLEVRNGQAHWTVK
jgi:RHS repeat-associated protein